MALSARSRTAGAAPRDRTFALQQAAAGQMARRRPVGDDTRAARQQLNRAITEAEQADIYDPAQIKQARIFANLDDVESVRRVLGTLPSSTAKRRELQEQMKAVDDMTKQASGEIRQQLNAVNAQLRNYTEGTQELLLARPEFMETVSPETQEALSIKAQLTERLAQVTQQSEEAKRGLQMGITISKQRDIQAEQLADLQRQEGIEQKRLAARAKVAGQLSEKEELAIDLIRDRQDGIRKMIGQQIKRLAGDIEQFEDESDEDFAKRVGPINDQIYTLQNLQSQTYTQEKTAIESFLKDKRPAEAYVKGRIYTNSAGYRARFLGYNDAGQPMMDLME